LPWLRSLLAQCRSLSTRITDATSQAQINGGLQILNLSAAIFCGALMVDKLGRRTLLIWSAAGMVHLRRCKSRLIKPERKHLSTVAYLLPHTQTTGLDRPQQPLHRNAIRLAGQSVVPLLFIFHFHFHYVSTSPSCLSCTPTTQKYPQKFCLLLSPRRRCLPHPRLLLIPCQTYRQVIRESHRF
jgi:hypothetical protein